jgi:transcriptional regulator with XRE-family HTH domain
MTVPSFNDLVSDEVRAEMARQRVSQHKLAAACGWTQAYLARRLTGRVTFSTDDLETIALALGVPLAQITGGFARETVALWPAA